MMSIVCRFVYETERFAGVAELLEILGRYYLIMLVITMLSLSFVVLSMDLHCH